MSKLTEQIIDKIAAEKGVSADVFSLSDITKLSDRDQKLYQRTGLNNSLQINSGSTSSNINYILTQKADITTVNNINENLVNFSGSSLTDINTLKIVSGGTVGSNLLNKRNDLSHGVIGDWVNGSNSELISPIINNDNFEVTTENYLYSGIRIENKLILDKTYFYRFKIKKVSGTTELLRIGLPGSNFTYAYKEITPTSDFVEIEGVHYVPQNQDFYIATKDNTSGGMVFQVKDLEIFEIKNDISNNVNSIEETLNFTDNKFIPISLAIQQSSDYFFELGDINHVKGKTIQYAFIPNNTYKIFVTTDFNIINDSFINGGFLNLKEDQIYLLTFFFDGNQVQSTLTESGVVVKSGVWADSTYYNNDFENVIFDGSQTFFSGIVGLSTCTLAVKVNMNTGRPLNVTVLIGAGIHIHVRTDGTIRFRVNNNDNIVDATTLLTDTQITDLKIVASYNATTGFAILNVNGVEYTNTVPLNITNGNNLTIGSFFNAGNELNGSVHIAGVWKGIAKNSAEINAIITAMT